MDVLSRPAEEFENDQVVEQLWAMKAFEHAEIYFNLLCSVNPRELKLTQYDDQIYSAFRQDFPDLDVSTINEDDMKSPEGKTKWRAFIEKFKHVDNFDFGTLIRTHSDKNFSAENSMLVVRIEFYAIEITRNREGHNDSIRLNYKAKPRDPSNDIDPNDL